MPDEKSKFFGFKAPDRTSPGPAHVVPTRARGLVGALNSYSNRRSAERITREQEAQERLYTAATRLAVSKETYARTISRMTPEHFERIAFEEQLKAEAEYLEVQLRHADAIRRMRLFERKAELEEIELDAELILAKERLKTLKDRVAGTNASESNEEPSESIDEKRNRLETELEAAVAEQLDLGVEYAQALKAGSLDDASEMRFAAENNRLQTVIDRLREDVASL